MRPVLLWKQREAVPGYYIRQGDKLELLEGIPICVSMMGGPIKALDAAIAKGYTDVEIIPPPPHYMLGTKVACGKCNMMINKRKFTS